MQDVQAIREGRTDRTVSAALEAERSRQRAAEHRKRLSEEAATAWVSRGDPQEFATAEEADAVGPSVRETGVSGTLVARNVPAAMRVPGPDSLPNEEWLNVSGKRHGRTRTEKKKAALEGEDGWFSCLIESQCMLNPSPVVTRRTITPAIPRWRA